MIKTKNIFIVEDNAVYAKAIQDFLQSRFSEIKEIKIFPIGEMCLPELEMNPAVIIMDYFLNSRYDAAGNGLEIIRRIRLVKPATNIIVLSIQKSSGVISEATKELKCIYIQKNQDAFNVIERSVERIFSRILPRGIKPLS